MEFKGVFSGNTEDDEPADCDRLDDNLNEIIDGDSTVVVSTDHSALLGVYQNMKKRDNTED